MSQISWQHFEKVDIRLGSVIEAEPFPETRKPSIKLAADFGPEVGVKKTSAQLTEYYSPETLLGRQVVAVANFTSEAHRGLKSEVLVLGVPDEEGAAVLLAPDRDVPPAGRMY